MSSSIMNREDYKPVVFAVAVPARLTKAVAVAAETVLPSETPTLTDPAVVTTLNAKKPVGDSVDEAVVESLIESVKQVTKSRADGRSYDDHKPLKIPESNIAGILICGLGMGESVSSLKLVASSVRRALDVIAVEGGRPRIPLLVQGMSSLTEVITIIFIPIFYFMWCGLAIRS
jgi:hypothetical protein